MEHVKQRPAPMPLPRPREEMHPIHQMIWDQRRLIHASENGIPWEELTDIKFADVSFIQSDGYDCAEDIVAKWDC
ncbi:MAG: hypothetical protein JO154_10120 [Chitinophaga sp.]|uniref:hypothetical protein n=1 Tax=Chitinophaga sp. TaxID=1869181 RepID=UPI0025C692EE|nr:hypothetical protein [Chitinophaga sp.]MBV8252949.1 hypothetical protein [Chitinophaga sp.]